MISPALKISLRQAGKPWIAMMTSQEQLVRELKSLGMRPRDVVMTHASMRRIGRVEGGATGLIDAQLEAAGHDGTFLMVLSAGVDEPRTRR